MIIHNVTEDRVRRKVREILDEEKEKGTLDFKTSYQNEVDLICYVLNRAEPEYVVSGRGMAHMESDYQARVQKETDIETLILEGIRKIKQAQRPHSGDMTAPPRKPQGPYFNFPTVMGRIFHGETFSPVSNMDITLYNNEGEMVTSIDPNWQNPFHLVSNTAGTFLFWPPPVKAKEEGEKRIFGFEVRIKEKDYEDISHFFEITLTADEEYNETFNTSNTFKIKDLYLFHKDTDSDLL